MTVMLRNTIELGGMVCRNFRKIFHAPRNEFSQRLCWIAALGVVVIVFIPPLVSFLLNDFIGVRFEQGDGSKEIRTALLYMAGGLIALVTLNETHSKNKNEKEKNDNDAENIRNQIKVQQAQLDIQKEQLNFQQGQYKDSKIREVNSSFADAYIQLSSSSLTEQRLGANKILQVVDDWLNMGNKKQAQSVLNNIFEYIRKGAVGDGRVNNENYPFENVKWIVETIKEYTIRSNQQNSTSLWSDLDFNFDGCTFNFDVDLSGIDIHGNLSFRNSTFAKSLDMSSSKIQTVNFYKVSIMEEGIFNKVNFMIANFVHTRIDKASFANAKFKSVIFQETKIEDKVEEHSIHHVFGGAEISMTGRGNIFNFTDDSLEELVGLAPGELPPGARKGDCYMLCCDQSVPHKHT